MRLSRPSIPLMAPIMLMAVSCMGSTEPTSNAAAPPPPKQALVFDFERDEADKTPAGFTAALTGGGGPVKWQVQEVDDAPSGKKVVAQLSDDRTNRRYPQLVRDDFQARDVDVSVRFKTISGEVDAAGGLVFRYKNNDNFYVVRANALEGNVVAYKTENGQRSNIGVKGKGNAYGVKADVPHQRWNMLRVVMKGELIEVFLNSRKLFEVENDTFTEAGKVGLWTKADAVTQFDDLRAASLDQAAQPETTTARLTCTLVDAPSTLDGSPDDPAWKTATELKLDAEGRGGEAKGKRLPVTLRATHDNENIYFLLRWPDATKDATHKSYVWNESEGAYEAGPDREDNAALSFPIKGEFTADMLSGKDELWDVWHWKAFRTGPAGYAMDRTHVYTRAKPQGNAKNYPAKSGGEVWIARPEDSGDSVIREFPAPTEKQPTPPKHYEAVKPSGSAADIRTAHGYENGWWTVEWARKLSPGHTDDAAFDVTRTILLGVAVFDKSEHEHHYTARPIMLSFEPR